MDAWMDAVCLFHAGPIAQHQFGQTQNHQSRLRSSLRTVAVLSLSTADGFRAELLAHGILVLPFALFCRKL